MTRYTTILILSFLLLASVASAQVRRVQENKKPSQSTDMSVRAKSFIESSSVDASHAQWSRVIYRELNLTKGPNASLYFPEEPMIGQTNLFRLMINLMAEGKIPAYEYLDGREIFTERYILNMKDMLDKFHILYEEKAAKGKSVAQYLIDENDVPCNEVQSYYIKERWVFDQRGSMFFSQIEAICPILHRTGDFGGDVTKYPMFWIPYEKIRPYLTQHQIMSEGMNNTLRYTFDDFFVLRQYEGSIYKTMNLRNQSLMQLYPNADSLKVAQDKIEKELADFQDALWVAAPEETPVAKGSKSEAKNDVIEVEMEETVVEKGTDKEIQRTRTSVRSNPRAKSTETKKEKSTTRRSSADSAPIRSVRRTR